MNKQQHDQKAPAFYIPKRLPKKLVEKLTPEERQHAYYFLNLLHWKWCCWRADERGFVHLKMAYLRRVIPPPIWDRIRKRLVHHRVIGVHDYWTKGKSAKGYRLEPKFQKTERIVCTDANLTKRIRRVYKQDDTLLPVHRWLDACFSRLRFDIDRAASVISTLKPDAESEMPVAEYRRLLGEVSQRLASCDAGVESVDRFGRVHTPITRLHRDLRCCLSVDGQPLVNIDLANSQPLIAGIVAASYFRDKDTGYKIRTRVFDDSKSPYHKRLPPPVDTDREDLMRFITECENGTIYESLIEEGDDRETVKLRFLTVMYAANTQKLPFKKVIASRYPSLMAMLVDLKRKDNAHAASIMQNIESTIFIHGCCRQIMKEQPDVPVFTIHDSLMTTGEHAQYVESVIRDQFGKIGVRPTLRREK